MSKHNICDDVFKACKDVPRKDVTVKRLVGIVHSVFNNLTARNDTTAINTTAATTPNLHTTLLFHISLIPAVLIILTLSMLHGRKAQKGRCIGRNMPGQVIPMDFLYGKTDRIFYALAFAALSNELIIVIFRNYTITQTYGFTVPGYIKVLFLLIYAVESSVIFYPLFACLYTVWKLVGNFLGLLYCIFCLGKRIYQLAAIFDTVVYPQVTDLRVVFLIIELPSLMCYFFLLLKFTYGFAVALWKKSCYTIDEDKIVVSMQYNEVYVKNLFNGKRMKLKFFRRRFFNWKQDFKYSTVIVATFTLCGLFIYLLGIAFIAIPVVLSALRESNHVAAKLVVQLNVIPTINVIWCVALALTTILTILWLFLSFKNHRFHLLSLYAGKKEFLPSFVKDTSSSSMLIQGMRYPGYQVAYTAWGFIMQQILLFLVIGAFYVVIIRPITLNNWNIIRYIALSSVVPIVIKLLLKFFQKKIIYRFMLADKVNDFDTDKPLAVKNISMYQNMSFMMVFWNILSGFISSLLRIMKSLVLCAILLPSLDRPALVKNFEHLDNGHKAYIGFLYMEYTHSHPVMKVFIQKLINSVKSDSNQNKRRIHTRWLLMYTLVKNPSLCQYRKKHAGIKHSALYVENQSMMATLKEIQLDVL